MERLSLYWNRPQAPVSCYSATSSVHSSQCGSVAAVPAVPPPPVCRPHQADRGTAARADDVDWQNPLVADSLGIPGWASAVMVQRAVSRGSPRWPCVSQPGWGAPVPADCDTSCGTPDHPPPPQQSPAHAGPAHRAIVLSGHWAWGGSSHWGAACAGHGDVRGPPGPCRRSWCSSWGLHWSGAARSLGWPGHTASQGECCSGSVPGDVSCWAGGSPIHLSDSCSWGAMCPGWDNAPLVHVTWPPTCLPCSSLHQLRNIKTPWMRLIHWSWDKMGAILLTTLSNAFF